MDCVLPQSAGHERNLKADSVQETCAAPRREDRPPPTSTAGDVNCHTPHGSPSTVSSSGRRRSCAWAAKWPHHGHPGDRLFGRIQQRGSCTDCHKEIHGSDRATFKD